METFLYADNCFCDWLSKLQVSADVVSMLTEKAETITLDLCTCVLPLLAGLLDSQTERYCYSNIVYHFSLMMMPH
jgi:con80 domain of Katanin